MLLKDHDVIPLVLVAGIKYTTRSISIDLVAKQIMVLDKEDPSVCMISRPAYAAHADALDEPSEEESLRGRVVQTVLIPPPRTEHEASPSVARLRNNRKPETALE